MERSGNPNSINTKQRQMKHWSTGLLDSMEDPAYKVTEDDKVVVIRDKFPKAEYHFLVLSKEDIPKIWDVQARHESLLWHMHNVGEDLIRKHDDHEFIMGYHAIPTMYRLHLHVISTDFNSPCLKTQPQWNSFTTPFLMKSEDICSQLQEEGKLTPVNAEEYTSYLKTDLMCHKCSTKPKNMRQLKMHLPTHLP